ncbi:MAG TPA: hypothetical protein VFG23_27870 [Polyangia bacterium]|jgi:hypothetical protein|nr:hypothetical protein [Polyangia bacterium]
MQRTAEEFVHQLPGGRWFVGDFLRTDEKGETVYLVELGRLAVAVELATAAIVPLTHLPSARRIRTYARKSSAKRAAQQMIERVLGRGDS